MHTSTSATRDETLQSLAYACWLRRGRPLGSPEIDWSEAEEMYAASLADEPAEVAGDSRDDITVVNSALDRTNLIDADSSRGADANMNTVVLEPNEIPTLTEQARAV